MQLLAVTLMVAGMTLLALGAVIAGALMIIFTPTNPLAATATGASLIGLILLIAGLALAE